ncbi:MAG TPA: DUF5666 domain-containing protein [Gammaproteobacteria bacterium]
MIRSRRFSSLRAGAILAAAIATACGIDQGGIERPPELPQLTVISGPVTGFGSVHVNGLVLEAAGAQIRVDGGPAVEADLRRGQVIRAIALVEPGASRALSIEYQSNLAGSVDALDAAAGTLTVLGQRVRVDAATALDLGQSAALSSLSLTDRVTISGLRTPAGEILATYVGRAGSESRITGSITNIDPAALTFAIGNLTVDYSQVLLLEVPNGIPQTGAIVEVTGATQIGGALAATQVRALPLATDVLAANATALTSNEIPVVGAASTTPLAANFVGFITASSAGVIELTDVGVSIGADTAIIGGSANALRTGVLVRVEGRIVGLGQIQADRITIL